MQRRWQSPILNHVITIHKQKQLWYTSFRVGDEVKVGNTSALVKRKRKHQYEAQNGNSHSIWKAWTIENKQHGQLLPE